MPKLSIMNIEQEGEIIECALEIGKHSTVTFKFNLEDDQPEDIAKMLVSSYDVAYLDCNVTFEFKLPGTYILIGLIYILIVLGKHFSYINRL